VTDSLTVVPSVVSPSSGRAAVGEVPLLRWPALDRIEAVDAVVTTRHGGVSRGPYESLNLGLHVGDDPAAVVENRRRAAASLGMTLGELVFARQSHGARVAVVGDADRGRGSSADDDALDDVDGLVTTDAGVGLVVQVADCVPIVLVDPEARVLGAVHAGWRGTVARVAAAAVDVMVARGARPGRILAGIGPAIEADRYQVGDEVEAAARETFGAAADEVVRPDRTGRWTFDLPAANRRVLSEAGLLADHIHLTGVGTSRDDLFSDRAERPCGRFAALARLRP
jgi:YfiH family protein